MMFVITFEKSVVQEHPETITREDWDIVSKHHSLCQWLILSFEETPIWKACYREQFKLNHAIKPIEINGNRYIRSDLFVTSVGSVDNAAAMEAYLNSLMKQSLAINSQMAQIEHQGLTAQEQIEQAVDRLQGEPLLKEFLVAVHQRQRVRQGVKMILPEPGQPVADHQLERVPAVSINEVYSSLFKLKYNPIVESRTDICRIESVQPNSMTVQIPHLKKPVHCGMGGEDDETNLELIRAASFHQWLDQPFQLTWSQIRDSRGNTTYQAVNLPKPLIRWLARIRQELLETYQQMAKAGSFADTDLP